MKEKIIAVVNQKGGVGKTTTSLNLGYALSQKGMKILLVDYDPQSSLTVCMGIDNPDDNEYTIASLMQRIIEDKEINPCDYIQNKEGVDFIPCSIELSAIEVSLVNAMSREMILKLILNSVRSSYDYIIIDCSPSLGMLNINALTACDEVLIPVTPEYLSAKGLELLLKNILRVKKYLNPSLEISGILLTMYQERINLSKEILKMIQEAYGKTLYIFNEKIPTSIKVSEASMNNKPIFDYAKSNKVAIAYKQLVEEVIQHEQ